MYEKYANLRSNANVTDSQIAKAIGITRSTFSDWKSGRSNPKFEKLKKIADYFGVPVTYFYED